MLRKLHSLTGVVPLGAFLILHLWTNAKALLGRQAFDEAVAEVTMLPFGLVLEVVFVLLPLLFHAGLGIRMALTARPNLAAYGHGKHWAYTMQRVTGLLALVFIVVHVWQFRLQRYLGKMDSSDFYGELCAVLSSTQSGIPWMALGYLIGLAACVFHFANGLYGFCFSWGITTSREATRRSSAWFGAVGVVLFALGASTIIYFATGSRFLFASPDTRFFSTTQTCRNEPDTEASEASNPVLPQAGSPQAPASPPTASAP